MNPLPLEPPLTVLLGLPFHDLSLDETLAYCATAMQSDHSRYLVTANVDFTTQAYKDADLRKIVFFADRVVCDGMPLVWLSRWFGYPRAGDRLGHGAQVVGDVRCRELPGVLFRQ